jgi:competence protein ComEC
VIDRLRGDPRPLAAVGCLGLAAAAFVRTEAAAVALVGLALLAAAAFARDRTRAALIAAGLLVVTWWWGSARVAQLDRSELASLVGHTGEARVVVTGPARRSSYSVRVPGKVLRFSGRALDEPVLLELPVGRSPPQGGILELEARVRAPRGPKQGFDERGWLRRQGVHAVLHGGRWRVVAHRGGIGGYADRVRAWLAHGIAPGLRGERRAVLSGIVLGEDEGLSEQLRQRFRASGLYHLLAVSGSNVAFVGGGVLLVAWLLALPRWLGELGAIAGIGSYVLAVGLQPSVVRAGIAGALASLAWLAARERDRWHILLIGALVLLAWNPYNVLDAGFQLSFAAVAAIFTAVPRLQRRLAGYPVPRAFGEVMVISLACGVATAPILWFQFGAIPLFSVFANALAAPVVALLLGFGFAAAFVGPVLPAAAEAIAAANGLLAAYLATCARVVGGLPFATVTSTRGLLVVLALVAVIVLAVRLDGRRRSALLACVALAALVFGVWRLWPHAPQTLTKGLRVTFLDVGQGDSTLLQVPGGAVLVDEGPPEAEVFRQLRRLGVKRLSLLVLTHPQRDHVGGAAAVLSAIDVARVLDPRLAATGSDEEAALREAKRRHVPVVAARAGGAISVGPLKLRVLWPDGPGSPTEDPNNRAIVLIASYRDTDVFLSADAESDVTLPLRPQPVEVMKIAHHGSSDDRLGELLERLRPQVAVISVGAGNTYGHPTPSTLWTLTHTGGLQLYRTDQDGRVVIESDGERLQVHSDR